jgi:hypothetical protein
MSSEFQTTALILINQKKSLGNLMSAASHIGLPPENFARISVQGFTGKETPTDIHRIVEDESAGNQAKYFKELVDNSLEFMRLTLALVALQQAYVLKETGDNQDDVIGCYELDLRGFIEVAAKVRRWINRMPPELSDNERKQWEVSMDDLHRTYEPIATEAVGENKFSSGQSLINEIFTKRFQIAELCESIIDTMLYKASGYINNSLILKKAWNKGIIASEDVQRTIVDWADKADSEIDKCSSFILAREHFLEEIYECGDDNMGKDPFQPRKYSPIPVLSLALQIS